MKRRPIEVFSLSFLDCICCGFGAIILLFVLTIGPIKQETKQQEKAVEAKLKVLETQLEQLLAARADAQASTEQALESTPRAEQPSSLAKAIVELETRLERVSQAIQAVRENKQAMAEEKQAIASLRTDVPTTPIGVPTESEHLLFLIDTSGSMRTGRGQMNPLVLRQIERTLNAYPEVKALQVMDCSGNYIMPEAAGRWIPDTPSLRAQILRRLQEYQVMSISNPVPGLIKAFDDFEPAENPGLKMGIYIFGDEFTQTAAPVLRKLNELNPILDPVSGQRAATVNAVGFPFRLRSNPKPNETGYKFAALMRELTYQHGGAFMVVRR